MVTLLPRASSRSEYLFGSDFEAVTRCWKPRGDSLKPRSSAEEVRKHRGEGDEQARDDDTSRATTKIIARLLECLAQCLREGVVLASAAWETGGPEALAVVILIARVLAIGVGRIDCSTIRRVHDDEDGAEEREEEEGAVHGSGECRYQYQRDSSIHD